MKRTSAANALYRALRTKTWEELWQEEVDEFNRSPLEHRVRLAPVVRALATVASEEGDARQREITIAWLIPLLRDPVEKVRRYAAQALPKLGNEGEHALLTVAESGDLSSSERRVLAATLERLGRGPSLQGIEEGRVALPVQTHKIKANIARETEPGDLSPQPLLQSWQQVRIVLRCRRGLEPLVAEEFDSLEGPFKKSEHQTLSLVYEPTSPFALSDLLACRTASGIAFLLGTFEDPEDEESELASIAQLAASSQTESILKTWTRNGPPRFRIEFSNSGHRRSAVRKLGALLSQQINEALNDPRAARWAMVIETHKGQISLLLEPRFRPDPRFAYRIKDLPAATHPPLAAALARVAKPGSEDHVFDPFCGSGLEIIECLLQSPRTTACGCDIDPRAIEAARLNCERAGVSDRVHLVIADFRESGRIFSFHTRPPSMILTNPPMNRRVPVGNVSGMISEMMDLAACFLRKKGRLVFFNPLTEPLIKKGLSLRSRLKVDLGGFAAHLEIQGREEKSSDES